MVNAPSNSVTYIIGQLILGGAEKQLYLLAKGLVARGWSVSVITLHGGHGDYWDGPIRELGVPFCEVTDTSRLARLLKMRSFVQEHPTRFLHSWSGFTGLYAALLAVLTNMPICLGSQRSVESLTVRELGFPLYWLSYALMKGIATNSRAAQRELERRWPRSKVAYIPNAIEGSRGKNSIAGRRLRRDLRARLHIPRRARVVGSVGALEDVKRFDRLIEAVRLLRQDRRDWMLVLVGDGPLRDRLHEQARLALGETAFHALGAYPTAEEIMPAFDAFCLCSDDEGTPNVVLEAMTAGVPVLVTDVGDVREIIKDRWNGIVLASNRPATIARSIRRLFANPATRRRMAKHGRERVLREYGLNSMVDAVIGFYESMVPTSGR